MILKSFKYNALRRKDWCEVARAPSIGSRSSFCRCCSKATLSVAMMRARDTCVRCLWCPTRKARRYCRVVAPSAARTQHVVRGKKRAHRSGAPFLTACRSHPARVTPRIEQPPEGTRERDYARRRRATTAKPNAADAMSRIEAGSGTMLPPKSNMYVWPSRR
jgi:hypothetical protein